MVKNLMRNLMFTKLIKILKIPLLFMLFKNYFFLISNNDNENNNNNVM